MRGFAAAGLCVFLAACQGTPKGTPFVWTPQYEWSPPKPHPALVDGAWVRLREIRNIAPPMGDEFVGAEGRSGLVRTWDELRPLLRPVTNGPSALALLDLVQRVEVNGSPDLARIRKSFPLRFRSTQPEDPWPFEAFRPSDAARWGIPQEPETTVTARGIEVHRPVWRPLRKDEPEGPAPKPGESGFGTQPGVVEYVADEVARDGAVRRRVLRVLDTGASARPFGPFPRL